MSQFCYNCGAKLPDDAMFCSECGTKVKSAETVSQTVNTENILSVQPVVTPDLSGMGAATYVSAAEPVKTAEQDVYISPLDSLKIEETMTYTSAAEPVNTEDSMTYVSAAEPPKAAEQDVYISPMGSLNTENPMTYASAAEPPKAAEQDVYISPMGSLNTENPMTYASAAEPLMSENSASYTGGNSYQGGMQNQTPVTSVPPMMQDQPIPGFGAPGAKKEKKNKKDKPKKKKKGLLAFFIVILLLGSGAGAVWFLDSNGTIDVLPKKEAESTYKEAIDLYVKGIEKQDIDTFLDAYASFLVGEFVDGEGQYFMEEVYEEYESEAGEDITIKYEVTKEKEYSESKLEKLQKELEEDYDFEGTIEKAYDITTEFTIKGEDDEIDDRVKFLVVQIKGQWYLAEFDN